MHAVNLIASALRLQGGAIDRLGRPVELPRQQQREICCVTGVLCDCVPRGDCIGESFTTQGTMAAPNSDWISLDAYLALKHAREALSSWYCDGRQFVELDRAGSLRMIFDEQKSAAWCGYVTTSYKKHGSLVAPVNDRKKSLSVAFEAEVVSISDVEAAKRLLLALMEYRNRGISRAAIQSGGQDRYASGPPNVWMDFVCWARPLAGSAPYRLLAHLMPGKEDAWTL